MARRPYCIGLTGGVGAGKSTVTQMFAQHGAGIVDTDVIAHGLTAPGGAALPAVVAEFGAQALTPEGALDRPAMRARIFAEPTARARLEAILHPLIRAEVAQAVQTLAAPYVILVVPLLAEHLAAYRELVDRILVVDCVPEVQVQRAATRPGMDAGQVEAIVAAQTSRETRLALADDVIENQGALADLEPQVARLHGVYRALAGAASAASRNNSLQ